MVTVGAAPYRAQRVKRLLVCLVLFACTTNVHAILKRSLVGQDSSTAAVGAGRRLTQAAAELEPGTPAVSAASGSSKTAAPAPTPSEQSTFGWLFPVSRTTKRGNCVVYEGKGSENLQQVASLFGLSYLRVLADNQGVITDASQPLAGKSILLCGQHGQAAPKPIPQGAKGTANEAGPASTPHGMASIGRRTAQMSPAAPIVSPKTQQEALLQLKSYLDPQKAVLKDWAPTQVAPESRVSTTSHCTWVYVACDDSQNVVRLNMVYLGLDGKLPPGSVMKNLPYLQYLYLGGNTLQGSLPAEWATDTKLTELFLNDNSLTGSLPPAWGSMSSLKVLSLAYNQLTGTLPAAWGQLASLEDLKLNNNQLAGSLPASWSGMKSLSTITLWNNQRLSGCIPATWNGKGKSGKGFFQAPTGVVSDDVKVAALGTAITGFCSPTASKPPAATPAEAPPKPTDAPAAAVNQGTKATAGQDATAGAKQGTTAVSGPSG